ncbi:hypothetical protein ACFPYJ_25170 [Paenibacillus solisilvae]|uniref:Uncharacterized protein n=1 Tax=Paenibacillus solisilvae TaxID=2486751 RepID=A0ABW0W5M0_9BACL
MRIYIISLKRTITVLLLITLLGQLIEPLKPSIVNGDAPITEDGEAQFTVQMILDRFQTTDAFIQTQVDNGYSLTQVFSIFAKAELDGSNYDQARAAIFPTELNLSNTAASSVYNQLPAPTFGDISVFTDNPYSDRQSDTASAIASKSINATSNTFSSSPVEETAPAYSKTVMNQAPFSVGSSGESISTLSRGVPI